MLPRRLQRSERQHETHARGLQAQAIARRGVLSSASDQRASVKTARRMFEVGRHVGFFST
jgi:hypothetical protein